MIISFDIKNKNDYKKIFIDPPISTVQQPFGKGNLLVSDSIINKEVAEIV